MTPDINLSHLTPATRTVPASVFGEHLAGERDCLATKSKRFLLSPAPASPS